MIQQAFSHVSGVAKNTAGRAFAAKRRREGYFDQIILDNIGALIKKRI